MNNNPAFITSVSVFAFLFCTSLSMIILLLMMHFYMLGRVAVCFGRIQQGGGKNVT